jgi:hypothetical protein
MMTSPSDDGVPDVPETRPAFVRGDVVDHVSPYGGAVRGVVIDVTEKAIRIKVQKMTDFGWVTGYSWVPASQVQKVDPS